MNNFHSLDPISLKAFFYASVTLNFTKAAELAALTQSGVSQHIARLESQLGISLFLRSGRKVILTSSGLKLKDYVELYQDQIQSLFEKIQIEGALLEGLVRYAMPDSCLMTPHFPQLLEKRTAFEGILLNVNICHSDMVLDLVLNGEIDFGFVTKPIEHKDIEAKLFAEEEHVLVGKKNLKSIKNPKDLKDLQFVNYPGMSDLYYRWFHLEFPKKKPLDFSELNISGEINSLKGAITMTEYGVGHSIFPRHCVNEQIKQKKLKINLFQPNAKKNPIYLIQLKNKNKTLRVQTVINAFWEIKSE